MICEKCGGDLEEIGRTSKTVNLKCVECGTKTIVDQQTYSDSTFTVHKDGDPLDLSRLEKLIDAKLRKRMDDLDKHNEVDSITDFSALLAAKINLQTYRTQKIAEEQITKELNKPEIGGFILMPQQHPHVDIEREVLVALEEKTREHSFTQFDITRYVNDLLKTTVQRFDAEAEQLRRKYGEGEDARNTS